VLAGTSGVAEVAAVAAGEDEGDPCGVAGVAVEDGDVAELGVLVGAVVGSAVSVADGSVGAVVGVAVGASVALGN
jgi:hypothetical protein